MQLGDKQPSWKTEAENNVVTTVLRKIFQNKTDVISLSKFSGGGRHRNYQTNAKREMKRLTSQYSQQFQDYLHSRRTIGRVAVRGGSSQRGLVTAAVISLPAELMALPWSQVLFCSKSSLMASEAARVTVNVTGDLLAIVPSCLFAASVTSPSVIRNLH